MQIVADSKKVLNEIYNLLNETSRTLVIEVPLDEIANKLEFKNEYLNICIHYLILGDYLSGDVAFNSRGGATKSLTLTAKGIEKVENSTL